MKKRVSLTSCLLLVSLTATCDAGVLFLSHYNRSLDADFSITGRTRAEVKDVLLTTGKQGRAFANSLPSPEAADIGYSRSASPGAGVYYDSSSIDVRQGTIQMWVKTTWDWTNTQAERNDKVIKNRQFFRLKLKGGIFNSINLYFACDQGHGFIPHLMFYIYDGKRDYGCNVRVGPDASTDFRWQKDTWHYLVATWTPTRMALYGDGKKLQERDFEVPMDCPLPEGPILLGNSSSTGPPAQALIDEVRLLDFPLTEKEATTVPTMELSETLQGPGIAAGGPSTFYRPETRRYFAYQVPQPPSIDGDLSDRVWENIPGVSGFVGLGLESKLVRYQSEVKAAWDKGHLYLAIFCHEDKLDTLRVQAKTDQDMAVFGDDAVEIFLSPDPAGRPFVQMGINLAKAVCGFLYEKDGRRTNWVSNVASASRRGKQGWSLEVAIPFADLRTTPQIGTTFRWNVCRDRRAAGGLEYSSMNFVSQSFLEPSEYGDLVFSGEPRGNVQQEEASLNKDYLLKSAREMKEFISRVDRELCFVKEVPAGDKIAAGIAVIEAQLHTATANLRRLQQAKKPSLEEWTANYFGLVRDQALVEEFSSKALALAVTAPEGTARSMLHKQSGLYRTNKHLWLVSSHLVAAVDARTGSLAGIWESKGGRRLLVSSYDLYYAENRKGDWRSDERLNKINSIKMEKGKVTLTAANPDLPGIRLAKCYALGATENEERILSCRTALSGKRKDTTLLKLSSNTILDDAFRLDCFYDRIFVIGTTGDQRQQIPAREIKEPIIQRAWFNSYEGRAQFSAFDPKTGTGLAQYLYKVDDRWTYPQGLAQSYWHPFGWEMGGPGDFFKATSEKTTSFETRYHLFSGDRLVFHREYMNLPEHKAVMTDWRPHPEVTNTVFTTPPGLEMAMTSVLKSLEFTRDNLLRPDELAIGLTYPGDNRWGMFPASDGQNMITRNPATGKEEQTFPCWYIKDRFKEVHQHFPWMKMGFYRFISDLYRGDSVYREHTEWILKDKRGKEVPGAFDQYCAAVNWHPAFMEHLLKGLLSSVDYFDEDMVYLDFSIGGWIVDWGREEVVKPNYFADWLKRLHTELASRKKVLWLNSFVDQYYCDLGFHEGDNCRDPWRVSGNVWMMRKIYTRPGNICIPLYWLGGDQFKAEGRENEERYRNLVLASGLKANGCCLDPYTKHFPDGKGDIDYIALAQYTFPIHAATTELASSQFVDIGLEPAWWRDFTTEYEAFTLRQDSSYLLNVISHYKDTRDATFAVDPKRMGFVSGKRLFCWQFFAREQKDFRKQAPQPKGWDRAFKDAQLQSFLLSDGKLKLDLNKLEPETVRMTCLTQVPACIYSASGIRTQMLLPSMLNCRISGSVDEQRKRLALHVTCDKALEVIAWWPRAWREPKISAGGKTVNGALVSFGTQDFVRFSLEKGEWEVAIGD